MGYASLRGHKYPELYKNFLKQVKTESEADAAKLFLSKILNHCLKSVPYYSKLLRNINNKDVLKDNPEKLLSMLPILTKDVIRCNFEKLISDDINSRKWFYNTSGGSTGEPIKIIQDSGYADASTAISLLFDSLAGREIGEPELYLWGSDKEFLQGTMGWKTNLFNFFSNTSYLNAFRMSPANMRDFLFTINKNRPKLILAYAQAIYELAKFACDNRLIVVPQWAIMTSAGTLYPWMREQIEDVFQCKVYNRYGSREVGGIACERPDYDGLWVAPWGNFIEIVDDDGNLLPAGVEGNILVTSLINFAMPLLRYKIGDRGILLSQDEHAGIRGQIFKSVTGRITDNFLTKEGKVIPGEYFIHIIGVFLNDGAINKFQIIQKDYDRIVLKIIKVKEVDTIEIIDKIKMIMGGDCIVEIEFVNEIPPLASGKYRYTISEVHNS
jgi:phenylacetate-CoA ligase